MDLRVPTPLNVKVIIPSKKGPMESTIEVIQCLAAMETSTIILVGEPYMYSFIYNVNRIRRNTLPNDYKYISYGRKYITLKLPESNSLLIIRVK